MFFIPMLLVSGTSGEFMEILPKTVIVCLLASLIECLFILPAHYLGFGVAKTTAELEGEGGGGLAGFRGMSLRSRQRVDKSRFGLRQVILLQQLSHELRAGDDV